MHCISRALLLSICLGVLSASTLLAQRGGAVAGRALLPSSTALGAGALSAFPSSTSRSTAPAVGRPSYSAGYGVARPGYGATRNYSRANNRREYRPLSPAYVAAPYYYPFFDWGGDYSSQAAPYDDSSGYGPDPATDAMLRNQAALGQQVQRLTAQLNDMMYGQGYQQQSPMAQEPPAPSIPITLVLRSGEQLRVQNYAITNNTFWDFGQTATRKIPLSSIDLAASSKATQANGGEFPQLDGTQ
jgi:hypothetical protein